MDKTQEELVQAIVDACEKLGWHICIPQNEDTNDDNIYGLIIGNDDFIDAAVGGSDEFVDFFGEDPLKDLDEDDITMSNVDLSKKKVTH